LIDRINIKSIATYDTDGIVIDGLNKVNFIYGANGTGKTTISRIIQQPDSDDFDNCEIAWKDDVEIKSLIYNKQFREQNFGRGSIAGVFTLGQATRDQIDAIELKKADLNKLKENGVQRKRTRANQIEVKQQHENDLNELLWESIYKRYEPDFKDAFTGSLSKERFKEKAILEHEQNIGEEDEEVNLQERAATIFKGVPERITNILKADFQRIIEIEEDAIWKLKVIGKSDVDISKLITRLGINDWVYEGLDHIQADDETCPFCQQPTIDQKFREQVKDFFDEEFLEKTKLIKDLSQEYKTIGLNIQNLLSEIESTQKNNSKTKIDIELYSSQIKTLFSALVANREILLNKEQEPSRAVELVSVKEQSDLIDSTIDAANEKINAHNNIAANYQEEKTKLINDIWFKIKTENTDLLNRNIRKSNGLQTGIDSLKQQVLEIATNYRALDTEIKDETRNVTSIQPTIDEINRILISFGFVNFKIVPSPQEENHYQIQREDGTLAEATLSEGEITFITFLYYLHLTKGGTSEDAITEDRILIIDDPISSLDSNILFIVSTLIKQLIKSVRENSGNIKQIILLTHNVYFHKEVSFINGQTTQLNDTKYWILRKNTNVTSIQCFELNNPIKNSYDLLWQELNNENNSSSVTVQNIMRRIIEHYFKLLGKYGDDDLINKFDTGEEQEICRSLICWINEGSHSIPDDLYIEQHDETKEKYLQVFKKIFQEMHQIEHYNMMMRNVNASR